MKAMLKQIAIWMFSLVALALIAICCTPYLVLSHIYNSIVNAYAEDRAVAQLHRDIEIFLWKERKEQEA